MPGKRQVTPSLVDIASSAERLSKSTATDDRTNPVSSYMARACTSAIATAAATAKATLDNSAKRAYVKLPLKVVARISVLPFPTSLNKSDGAQQLTRTTMVCLAIAPFRWFVLPWCLFRLAPPPRRRYAAGF